MRECHNGRPITGNGAHGPTCLPGSGESIYNPYRNQVLSDHHLYLDSEQFVKMGGKYLFSRYELDNAEELGFTLRGVIFERKRAVYDLPVRNLTKYVDDMILIVT
ncbi:MAG: DUF6044 family protein [Eisenbergiella sp.]